MISVGVIGAGLIGRKHIERVEAHPDFALAGIADVDRAGVQARYPGARVFGDYRELLAEARPDAAIIASPNLLHAEMGIACAEAGVHFIIEKPVTDTLEAARALVAVVQKSGVRTLVGHHRRHHDQVRVLREAMAEDWFGDLVGVSGIWATRKPASYFEAGPWRREAGGGPILINLIHEIDLLRYVAGEIATVSAVGSNRRRGFAVEDTAGAVIAFENGAIGTFLISDAAVSPWTTEQGVGESPEFPLSGQSSYRFVGTRGALEFPEIVRWSQPGGAQDWNQPVLAQRLFTARIDPYVAQLEHFRDVLAGRAESAQPVADGARTLAATLAVAQAAETGGRVNVPALAQGF